MDKVQRRNLAAFSLSSGALDRRWRPRADNRVETLAVAGSRVYLGGSIETAARPEAAGARVDFRACDVSVPPA